MCVFILDNIDYVLVLCKMKMIDFLKIRAFFV